MTIVAATACPTSTDMYIYICIYIYIIWMVMCEELSTVEVPTRHRHRRVRPHNPPQSLSCIARQPKLTTQSQSRRGVYPPHAHGAFYCSGAYPRPANTCSCCRGDKPTSATARPLLLQGRGDTPLLLQRGVYPPLRIPTGTATTGGVTRCAPFSRFSNVAPIYVTRQSTTTEKRPTLPEF